MNIRQGVQIALILGAPLFCFNIVVLLTRDSYIPIVSGYLALLVVLRFADLENFLLFRHLQELWHRESEFVRQFLFDPADFLPPVVKATPRAMLNDANLYNIAKLKYLVDETEMFIPGIRDQFIRLVFINIFLLVALMIITTQNYDGAQQTSGSSAELLGRLLLSYFAVALQLVWFGRDLFHYRQKNTAVYFQTTRQGSTLNGALPGPRAKNEEKNPQEVSDMSERYVDFDLHIAPGGHVAAYSPEGQATADILTQVPNAISLALNLIEKRQTNDVLLT